MAEKRGRRVARPIEDLIGDDPAVARPYHEAQHVYEGARIVRTMRDLAGLSQERLASALDVSQPAISTIEAGRGTEGVTYATLKRVAGACGVDFSVRLEPAAD